MFKKVLLFLFIICAAILFWFGFALWTGIYSIYSYPPSREVPEGATLIIARDEGEPMFNSPQFKAPPVKKDPGRGIVFTAPLKPKRPIESRTIVELPYVEWAYQKSLESESPE